MSDCDPEVRKELDRLSEMLEGLPALGGVIVVGWCHRHRGADSAF